jgi:protein-L-isoaspartate(D-aspartate) O-methyltransferase
VRRAATSCAAAGSPWLLAFAIACASSAPAAPRSFDEARRRMVADQIEARGMFDGRVLATLRKVPRHEFVPPDQREHAYEDRPLPIGHGQTISQPYIVALMTALAEPAAQHRVLEVGTGSGYQAAVLAELVNEVYTIEILEPLARGAKETLQRLGYRNVHVRHGDGYRGWPEKAPFHAIIVTAAPDEVPAPLREQLAMGGRLVIPVGAGAQDLRVITRTATGFEEKTVIPVRFVPMTGEAQKKQGP